MLIDNSINEVDEIQLYAERKSKGEDFSSIRKELISKGYSEEKVASMMREIEDLVIKSFQQKKSSIPPQMIAGLILAVIGIVLIVIGIRGILSFVLIFTGVAMLAMKRTSKGGNIERSKWSRH